MSSDTKKIVDFAAKGDDYEALILDFLDREISASNKSPADEGTHQDDIDAEVSDFLKKVASLEAETGVMEEIKPAIPGVMASRAASDEEVLNQQRGDDQQEQTSECGTASRETPCAAKTGANLRLVEPFPRQRNMEQDRTEPHLGPDQVLTQATATSLQTPGDADIREEEKITAPLVIRSDPKPPSKESLNLSFPAAHPIQSRRKLVIGGVSFLLAAAIGAGTYYLGGFRARPAAKESKAVSRAAPAVPAKVTAAVPQQSSSAPAAQLDVKPAQTANPVAESTRARRPEGSAITSSTAKSGTGTKPAPVSTPASRPPATLAPPAPAATTVNLAASPAEATTDNAAKNPTAPPVANPAPATSTPAPPASAESTPPTASNPPTAVPPAVPVSNAAASPAKIEASKAPAVREVSPSAPISKVLPVYPETARRMKIEGKVDVDAQVDEQGKVVVATAINGHVLLRDAAMEAVKKWRFKPATLNGKNVLSSSRVSVVFKLNP